MLAAMAATVNTEGTSFEKPSLYFSPIAHAVSNAPATISRNQAMEPPGGRGKSVYASVADSHARWACVFLRRSSARPLSADASHAGHPPPSGRLLVGSLLRSDAV